MRVISASYETIPGTEAAQGEAGGHALIADRPDGIAGGQGLGFNGAQLLALAIGGCISNDLRYTAHGLGLELGPFRIDVDVALSDDGVTGVAVAVDGEDADVLGPLVAKVATTSTVVRAVAGGTPVRVGLAAADAG